MDQIPPASGICSLQAIFLSIRLTLCYASAMKLAGFLALIVAAVLGIWVATDYIHNEHERQYNVQRMQSEVTRELAGANASDSSFQESKEIASAEQFDGVIGIVACCALIGSVVLFSKSRTMQG